MYIKNLYVFWAQSENGILLQNIQTNAFLELNIIQGKIWEYLDGTFSEDNIVEVLSAIHKNISKKELKKKVQSTVKLLKDYDLISQN